MEQKPSFYKRHRTFNSTTTYNGQDVLKNHFLKKHPVIFTDDPEHIFQVHGKQSPTGYVWLVKHGIDVLHTFPWYFRPEKKKNAVHQFPHVYDNIRKVKSWTDVQLVPVDIKENYEHVHERHIAAFYDMYQGKEHFDVFYLGKDPLSAELKKYNAKYAEDIKDAQEKSETTFLYVVPGDVKVEERFKFNYWPDGWSFDYCHVFRNGARDYDGVILLTKEHDVSKNEEDFWFFRNTKFVGTKASSPKLFDIFYVNDYDDYLNALKYSKTEMFWSIPPDVDVLEDFSFKRHKIPRPDKKYVHVFKNGEHYDGVCLFNKERVVSKNEFDFSTFVNKKEINEQASAPKPYDKFTIDSYEDYCYALENTKSDFFWGVPSDVEVLPEFDFSYQVPKWQKKYTHTFLNGESYDGVCIFSKEYPLTREEVNSRQYLNNHEVKEVASYPKPYDIFYLNEYDEYLEAAQNATTSMFWVVKDYANIASFNFAYHVPVYDMYGKNTTHVFLKNNKPKGVFLFSTENLITRNEFNYEFFINKVDIETELALVES